MARFLGIPRIKHNYSAQLRIAKLPPLKQKTAATPAAKEETSGSPPWRLTPLDLSPPRRTRPPRGFLATWDIRVRRPTSPFWRPPGLLSPLREPASKRSARVHRGVQCCCDTRDRATQSSTQWEASSDDEDRTPLRRESRSTRAEATRDQQTQTSSLERSYTPPGTPSALRRWGPRKVTATLPHIEWRERL